MSPLNEFQAVNLEEVIKPASESKRAGKKTFLLIGSTGNGKTTSIRTIPSNHKALVLDFDGKASILQTGEWDDKIDIVDVKFSITDHKKQLDIVNSLYKIENCQELASKYQWLVIDSLTNFYHLGCQAAHDSVSGQNRFKMNFDKMDFVDDWIYSRLQRWSAYFQFLVLITHEDLRESETGIMKIVPFARKALSQGLPKNFTDSYHSDTEGLGDDVTYCWRTKPEEVYGNTSSFINLPAKIPSNFSLLLETDWSKVKDVKEAIERHEKKTGNKIEKFL